MADQTREQLIDDALAEREKGDAKAALDLLLEYGEANLDDAEVALLIASSYDSIGKEREAVPWYERALEADLVDAERISASIGLGSSLRALGEYDAALKILGDAHERFPINRAIETFLAMVQFNAGEQQKAFETILRILAENSGDQDIRAYAGALTFYAEDVAYIWQ